MSVPAPRKGPPFRAHAHAFLTEPHLGCSHLLLVLTPSPSENATSQTCRLQISKVFDLFHSEKLINTSLRIPWAYQELGPDYFDQLHTQQLERHYVRRLEALGFQVTLTTAS